MEDHALIRSLTAQQRALEDTIVQLKHRVNRQQDLIDGLQARVEQASAARAVLRETIGAIPVPPPTHRRPRNPHGFRVIRGGAAALAPVGLFLAHGGIGPAAMTAARWVWRAHSNHVRYAVAAALLGVTATAALPQVVNFDPEPGQVPSLVAPDPHDRPPARPLHHHPGTARVPAVPMARAAHRHRHRRRQAVAVLPTMVPDPSPSPAPMVTPSPSPSVTATGSQLAGALTGD